MATLKEQMDLPHVETERNGVNSTLFFALTSAPFSINNFAISTYPTPPTTRAVKYECEVLIYAIMNVE